VTWRWRWSTRALGLFIEPSLQAAILDERWLVDVANWVYVWGHWPVIAGVGVWLYRSRSERYRLVRNALLISGAIGLVIFAAFPVAPPRLADIGVVDTVAEHSNFYRVLQPPPLTNQYAALPSLHFGWNLLIGIALMRESTHRAGRLVGAALPLAMLAAVVLTANHYLVDTLAGGAIALIGLRLALIIQNRSPVEETGPGRITLWRSAVGVQTDPTRASIAIAHHDRASGRPGDDVLPHAAPPTVSRSLRSPRSPSCSRSKTRCASATAASSGPTSG
jgi:hypothetical protein